jgi:serine/threonine-protein kinase HipA
MDHADFRKPGQYSYEELMTIARTLGLPRVDAIEIFRRMVFNVIARNQDDHTKNFGFLLDHSTAGWRLAPAFDIAYSYKPGSYWVDTHQMTINGKRDVFTRTDLLEVAASIGRFSSGADEIIDEVIDVVSRWEYFAQQAGVHEALIRTIQSNMRLSL